MTTLPNSTSLLASGKAATLAVTALAADRATVLVPRSFGTLQEIGTSALYWGPPLAVDDDASGFLRYDVDGDARTLGVVVDLQPFHGVAAIPAPPPEAPAAAIATAVWSAAPAGTPLAAIAEAVRREMDDASTRLARIDAATAGAPAVTPPPVPGPLFRDDFASAAPGPAWSTVGGTWVQAGGLLRQTSLADGDPKKAAVTGVAFPQDVEVRARVCVDTWAGGGAARAGLSLGDDAAGRGYNLLFAGDTDTVRFLHDHVAWGDKYTFAWRVGAWYRFALRQQGGVLLGKVWADGQAEPAGWMFRQEGWAARSGAPGLNGGSGAGSTARFADFEVRTAPA